MKKILTAILTIGMAASALGQTTLQEMSSDLNKTGGVYYAYPSVKADNTPAPRGYKPFHISHYGRHGSRYLISDNDYIRVHDLLVRAREAGALTPLGIDILNRLDSVMTETNGRGGDLSPLGRRQHHDIAARMYANYPEVFTKDASILARSTLVPRCILSMASFCESLKERNPQLTIGMESSNRFMPYICSSTKASDEFNSDKSWWREVYRKMEKRNTKADRLTNSIFSDKEFVKRYVDPEKFMWMMYWLASDAQNTELKISFYDVFTPQELFDLWQCFNAIFYAQHSTFPPAEGKHIANARPLLRNVIETADAAIASDKPSAALRFGHDGNVVPFTALMGLEGCDAEIENEDDFYKGWCDWKVSPMGANIQMIFFRNPKQPDDVLVKFLHNEQETHIKLDTDIWPYYHWKDVKEYFNKRIDNLKDIK